MFIGVGVEVLTREASLEFGLGAVLIKKAVFSKCVRNDVLVSCFVACPFTFTLAISGTYGCS